MNLAWNQLYTSYAGDVLRISNLFLKNRTWAEDVCHEVFVRCIAKQVNLREGHEKAFLVKCAVNLCRDELKSARIKRTDSVEVLPELSAPDSSRDAEVYEAVLQLEQPLRAVFVLHDYQGFTLQETAEILHVPSGTAAGRLRKARELLAGTLREEVTFDE